MSRACLGSAGAGPSGVESLEYPGLRLEGFDLEDGDEGVELDLDDEPETLLIFLNARRQSAKSLYRTLPGLPRRIKLGLLDFLTSKLDRELSSHDIDAERF